MRGRRSGGIEILPQLRESGITGGIGMAKILVMGGTRFFGKRLVELLLEQPGHEVVIATRGRTDDPFGDRVRRIRLERTDAASLKSAACSEEYWDIVYDNICYSPDEALAAAEAFAGRAGHYILTSSHSVYDPQPEPLTEEHFDPYTYTAQPGSKEEMSYQEGKRRSESVLLQKADFPVSAVRFPIVLGMDDYTERLHFHIRHVREGRPIGMPKPEAALSFIRSDEAAGFLAWLGRNGPLGPVNASSSGSMSPGEIVAVIERTLGVKAELRPETEREDMSPFGIPDTWVQDNAKASAAGFAFLELAQWLPELVEQLRDV